MNTDKLAINRQIFARVRLSAQVYFYNTVPYVFYNSFTFGLSFLVKKLVSKLEKFWIYRQSVYYEY